MRDEKISGERIDKLHPKVRGLFRDFIEDVEAHDSETCLRVTQGWRTDQEQHCLFIQPHDGKDNDGDGKIDEADEKVTLADAGQSIHNYALAIDLVEMDGDRNQIVDWKFDMATIKEIAKKYGIEWGGDWHSIKDKPHFQKTFGYTWQQLKELKASGKVDSEGYVII